MNLGSWMPLYQGIDFARGANIDDTRIPVPQLVTVARIDLTDPDIRLFATPRFTNYLEEVRETAAMSVSNFLTTYNLQLAINANFYTSMWGIDPPEGAPAEPWGLLISQGVIVSKQETNTYATSLLFTTNNQPIFVFTNSVPGTNTAGIYTAVTGNHPLLRNGQNIAPGPDQRTARNGFGVSQDRRYLYLLTIDSNSTNSGGAIFSEVASWLQLAGAYDAINLDGGGSTALDTYDCYNKALQLNTSFIVPERHVAAHFGVYAKPLPQFFSNVDVSPFDTTANIRWQTAIPTTAQIEYGTGTAYGSFSASNSTPLRNHVITLNSLLPATKYSFRIIATAGTNVHLFPCYFTTLSFLNASVKLPLFEMTNSWKYATNNLDGIKWQTPSYDDRSWFGPSPALFYIEDNPAVEPKNTGLPPSGGVVTGGQIMPTYYFRTHFTFNDDPAGIILYFTSYIDDGAVFYLNGAEIYRYLMFPAPTVILNSYRATGSQTCNSTFDAQTNCPLVFSISSPLTTNIVVGDNVLAVEVHQAFNTATDVVFGSALGYSPSLAPKPALNILTEDTTTTIYWNGGGFALQQAHDPRGPWTDIPGPVKTSPYTLIDPPGSKFFQLHRGY